MSEKTLILDLPKIPVEKEKLNELLNKYFLNKENTSPLMNYDKTCNLELKDMGNDIETWIVTDSSSKNVIRIGDYNYRNKPDFIDYSSKYKIFFYIYTSWTYKGGTYYYLHIHYKNNFYESYLSHDNYSKLSISPCGEKLIISINGLGIYEMELKDLTVSLENNTPLTKGQYFIDENEYKRKLENERKNYEAKMAYRMNYPNEYGDDWRGLIENL